VEVTSLVGNCTQGWCGVHEGLYKAVVWCGIPGLLLFVPKYHIKGVIHLRNRAGCVIPPVDSLEQRVGDAFTQAAWRDLKLVGSSGQLSICHTKTGDTLHHFVQWQQV
jgi:hypothetical protein